MLIAKCGRVGLGEWLGLETCGDGERLVVATLPEEALEELQERFRPGVGLHRVARQRHSQAEVPELSGL